MGLSFSIFFCFEYLWLNELAYSKGCHLLFGALIQYAISHSIVTARHDVYPFVGSHDEQIGKKCWESGSEATRRHEAEFHLRQTDHLISGRPGRQVHTECLNTAFTTRHAIPYCIMYMASIVTDPQVWSPSTEIWQTGLHPQKPCQGYAPNGTSRPITPIIYNARSCAFSPNDWFSSRGLKVCIQVEWYVCVLWESSNKHVSSCTVV